ncbi:MAG: DUF4253 domain-containing protein [Alphaproteobacteria bacterium]|nr:DUF4253 domain-containing protein [Alphaproteobacteria bacterium]
MRRRDVLAGLGAGALAASWPLEPLAATQDQVQRVEAYTRKALAKFPFKLHEVAGDKALEKWRQLKAERKGAPVVLGVDSANGSLGNLLSPFGPGSPQLRKVEQILQAAGTLTFPDDLARENKEKSAAALAQFKAMLAANPNMPLPQIVIVDKNGSRRTLNRQETIAEMEREQTDPPLGDWPVTSPKSDGPGLSVALDILTNKPLPKVYVAVAPTNDWTEIPAYLQWGGWNACPSAEHHVAALRLWRDKYGAELVGISEDTMNLRVARKPKTRDEALALARDHYVYCRDIIDQGVGTYSALAAELMANDWWYFWWD